MFYILFYLLVLKGIKMNQILQDMSNGITAVIDVPSPQVSPNNLIINTRVSLISAGTERMLVGFGKASYLEKAVQKPNKVKMVIEKGHLRKTHLLPEGLQYHQITE
jgi:hypothetical protein